ncbi:related to short-chain dehydrogenase/reductase [Ramularia collo-cygni]|uniref:Related to short-chain dehydrogenase/reductase n=1 Tax=Ramularia collo-cygni TaxID=112498 RepID=A0A2D3V383_9PEZI|nr:related to short-chain dehydrogenase/reductase [Ramularia collo-cygni]CZT19147.1 related to short-chain dehydrogenase/reductase [Ramularia collo-cygni]
MALSSRLAIIVGGVGGLGSLAGKVLRSQGASVALLYAPFEANTVQPTLRQVFESDSPDNVKTYECDITSKTSVDRAFAAIDQDDIDPPCILVNAAGVVNLHPLEDFPAEDALRHYMVNLYGPTLTGQAFAKLFFAASERARQTHKPPPIGRIVNIASQAAHVALDRHGPYCASKAGLIGLTKCQASEWGPRGLTANTISPGPVWTELGKRAWADKEVRKAYQAAVPTGKFAEPSEVVRIVSFLCQDEACNINGADFRLDGGYTAR